MKFEDMMQLFSEMASESAELKAIAGCELSDAVAGWIVPQYAAAARERLSAAPNGPERWKLLRLAANDLVALRRGDHSAARLSLEREKFAETLRQQQLREEQKRTPKAKSNGITPETLRLIEEELKLC